MIIEAKNISFSHREHQILKQVEVSVDEGELLIIIGPNGAGKSTLLSMLAHENREPGSAIYFKNKLFKNWDKHDLAHHKAKFAQENNKEINLSVKDIVLMGRYPYFNSVPFPEDLTIVDEMMAKTDVSAFRDRDYNTLSGGEKQRVHLARVLAQLQNKEKAKLAFFDEPLNNLDVRHQYRILETIRAFVKEGNSAVLVLHDLNLAAEFADTILLLKKGKVVAHGAPEYIFSEHIISKAYDFPCSICQNPITNNPMIVFSNRVEEPVF